MNDRDGTLPAAGGLAPAPLPRRSPKIQDRHTAQLAIVYVRQSSPQQVLEHRESRERQYALADHAVTLGWPKDRVLVIDDDQGQSGRTSQDRPGFQRLVAEVTLGHVGLVLGLEASRLARSNQDWHQLFELCAIFDTLLADEDGVYDARDPNDRLILGLKGMMSEVELLTMRNRLDRGKWHKAQRGELFMGVPMGYVKRPGGGVDLDPDEQVQAVVRLIFAKFDELGTAWAVFRYLVDQGIQVGQRVRTGARRGQLEWRRLSLPGVRKWLHHPIYAGAYVYGRRRHDPRRQAQGRGHGSVEVPMAEWPVLLRDRLPAYISWEQYLDNQERLRRNCSAANASGTPRSGSALLAGLVVCGGCGHRLRVSYQDAGQATYHCIQHLVKGTPQICYGLSAAPVDDLVATEVLRAVEPAALELSLQAVADLRQERERLTRHWQQQLERARAATERVERQYQAVEPEDRLVARTLERRWEEALQAEAHLREAYDRFLQEQAPPLSAAERARIERLAEDLPALWRTAGPAERKEVIRCLVERVVVQVRPKSNRVAVTIHWQGGHTSAHKVVRPVRTYEQMDDYAELLSRIQQLRQEDYPSAAIAAQLNAEGFQPPMRRGPFNGELVRQLLSRADMATAPTGVVQLEPEEWWLSELSRKVRVSTEKLRDWIGRGWVHARQTPVQGRWIVWADRDELQRLKRLRAHSARGVNAYPKELTTPKKRGRK
jgi:DNA invertase Pin-like site-specific DNA recombinase